MSNAKAEWQLELNCQANTRSHQHNFQYRMRHRNVIAQIPITYAQTVLRSTNKCMCGLSYMYL